MRRISKIRNQREAAIEDRREELRDRRWARHKSKILTFAGIASMLTASGKADQILTRARGVSGL